MSALAGPPSARGLVLVLTSPRVAPGLLSRSAWQALEAADRRLASSLDEPLAAAVAESGLAVALPQTYAEGSPSGVDEASGVDSFPAGGSPLTSSPASAPASSLAPSPVFSATAQRHDRAALARELVLAASTERIVWLGSADGDEGLTEAIASEVSRLPEPPEVEVVVGSWDVQGSRLLDVVAVMDRLRSPGGCPWDAKQTHDSLLPYLTEESEEFAQAVRSGDRDHMAEELGDVLLQVAFHARVAEDDEHSPFDIDDVAGLLVEKLVRRHPHVFADVEASTPEEVEANWARIKEQEKLARDDRGRSSR